MVYQIIFGCVAVLVLFILSYLKPFASLLLLVSVFPFEKVDIVEGISIVVPIGIIVTLAWVLRAGVRRLILGREAWMITALFIISLISMLSTGVYCDKIQSIFQGIVFVILVNNIVISIGQVYTLSAIAPIMLLCVVIYGIYLFISAGGVAGERFPGVIFDSNYYALYCVTLMPALIAVALTVRQRIVQVVIYVIIGIGASAFFFAQSRAGLISALVVSLLYTIQSKSKAIKRLMLLVMVIFIIASAIPVQYMSHWFEAVEYETYSTGTGAARLEAWMAGVKMFMEHPLSGVGLGKFEDNASSYAIGITQRRINEMYAHNSYIEIAAETGIGGLVLFVALMFCMAANLKKAVRNFTICGAKHAYNVAYGLYLGSIGYLVGQFFVSAQYRKYLWLMIGLSAAVRRISEVYIIKWQKSGKY